MTMTNVISMHEWKRGRTLDRAEPRSKVPAMDAGGRLRAQDWGKTLTGLTAFAYRRTGKRSWAHAEDLAQAAIAQLYTRPEAWDPAKEPLLKHLCKRVISLAANEWSRKRSSFEVLMEYRELHELPVSDESESLDDVIDRRRMAAKFHERLVQHFAGDETARSVIEAMSDGAAKPSEIAEATALKLAVVTEARRRIFYHATRISTELGVEIDEADDAEATDREEDAP